MDKKTPAYTDSDYQDMRNAVAALSMDAVQRANSGHPGRLLKNNVRNPVAMINRDFHRAEIQQTPKRGLMGQYPNGRSLNYLRSFGRFTKFKASSVWVLIKFRIFDVCGNANVRMSCGCSRVIFRFVKCNGVDAFFDGAAEFEQICSNLTCGLAKA